MVTGLFGLHPLQTQAVSYLSQRAEALAALFYLAGLLCLARSLACASPWREASYLLAAGLAFVLGLGAKEVAVTLPIAGLMYVLCIERGGGRAPAATNGRSGLGALVAVLAVAPGAYFALRVTRGPVLLATRTAARGAHLAYLYAIRRLESHVCRKFNQILAAPQANRRRFLETDPRLPVWVLPFQFGIDLLRVAPPPAEAGSLLFAGALHRDANADAVRYFCREILPRVRQAERRSGHRPGEHLADHRGLAQGGDQDEGLYRAP